MKVPPQAQFHRFAPYYDALNDFKDYHQESDLLEALVKEHSRISSKSWLDVACGTGKHLEHLRRRYEVAGVDLSPEMLRIARRRLPGVPLLRGDMRSFRTRRTYDVVSCLFSAIGHLRTQRDVRAAFANFYRHLNPGGVAIVEPWFEPRGFHDGFVNLRTYQGPEGTIARMAFSRKEGDRSIVRYHFLIGKAGKGVTHFVEREPGLLVSRDRLTSLMSEVGFKAHFLPKGLAPGRGLLIGVKRG